MTVKAQTGPGATAAIEGLAGVRPGCGCVTAALALWWATEEDIRDFYRSMADSGRDVRRMDVEVLRARWGRCPHS